MSPSIRLKESRVVYKGYIFNVLRDRFYHLKSKKWMSRDLVVHPGAVAVVPFVDKNHLILLRQYRYAAKGDLWEIPAGTREGKEAPLRCAQRELEEETGYKAGRFRRMTTFFSAPGISNEVMTVYRADNLKPGIKHLDHDEVIVHRVFSVTQALAMIRRGSIRDAKSIVAILWAAFL